MVLWACVLGFIACAGAGTAGEQPEVVVAGTSDEQNQITGAVRVDGEDLTTTAPVISSIHAPEAQEKQPPNACPSLTQPCKKALSWALHWGIYQRPEWYPNMTPTSPPDDFQQVIYKNNGPCPKPCGRHPKPTLLEAGVELGDSADPTLYCWLMMNTNSYELALVESQFFRKVGVFACDAHSVFSDSQVTLGSAATGTEESISVGPFTARPAAWGSFLNTDDFLRAWGKLVELQTFRESDWTIKADPDTVFFVHRLRQHLRNTPKERSVYFKNWREQFGFFGPLEVFSRLAVQAFGEGQGRCRAAIGTESSGEDGWMHSCMDSLGVGFPEDFDLLDGSGVLDNCRHTHVVAFHAFKQADRYFDCVDAGMQADAPPLTSTAALPAVPESTSSGAPNEGGPVVPSSTSTTASPPATLAQESASPTTTTTRAQNATSSPSLAERPPSTVTVVHVDHQDSSGGRYFFFEPDAWTEMVGNTSWTGNTYAVVQSRGGAEIWHGDVVVWDNLDGTYGRRGADEAGGQWQPGDEIGLQADQLHTASSSNSTESEQKQDFCCFAAPSQAQACSDCYDGARAEGGYCGASRSRCLQCGSANAVWCPAGAAAGSRAGLEPVPLKTSDLDATLKSFLEKSGDEAPFDGSAAEYARVFRGHRSLGGAVLALALAATLAVVVPLRSRRLVVEDVEGAEVGRLFLAHVEQAME